jgi:DNA-binding XRE family transcriptional regulator
MSRRSRRDEINLDAAIKIAKNLIAHRIWNGLTQTQIGDTIGVSFQQYQKIEKCVNRVYAEDLEVICDTYRWDIAMMYSSPEGILKEWCDRDYPNAQKKPHQAECIERKWNNTEISADKNYRRRTKSYNVFNNREE